MENPNAVYEGFCQQGDEELLRPLAFDWPAKYGMAGWSGRGLTVFGGERPGRKGLPRQQY
ncbi:hypothetical protein GOP47_0026767 [Adiantum capillus-veneris]|nr:hypothetical protein GOP47_0026767 [Adiantum capillus-veneris]